MLFAAKMKSFSGLLILLVLGVVVIIVVLLRSSAPINQRTIKYFNHNNLPDTNGIYTYKSVSKQAGSVLPGFLFPVSKEVVLFNAFFDSRSRNGHNNLTMIFLVGSKKVFNEKLIKGCGVGNTAAKDFHLRYVQEDNLMHGWLGIDKFNYEQLALECYDVPVQPGDKAFVTYQPQASSAPIVLDTTNPVVIPAPKVIPKGPHKYSVVVCSKAHSRGVTWLPEFLRYQKTLGVDHVHLAVLDAFIKDKGFMDYLVKDNLFLKNIREEFITLQLWKEWYGGNEWYVHGTILMYLDCIYRYRGTYDYVSLMDSDDFFTVRVPGMSYKDLIAKYCTGKGIGSCSFDWLWYYPGLCGMKRNVSDDGNVTAAMVPHEAQRVSGNLKSIHLTAAVLDSSFHDAKCSHCMMAGFRVVHVEPEVAYVAHQRMYMGKENKKVCPKQR